MDKSKEYREKPTEVARAIVELIVSKKISYLEAEGALQIAEWELKKNTYPKFGQSGVKQE